MKNFIFAIFLIFSACTPLYAGLLKQSTNRNVMFFMTSSTDNTSPKTGATVTCTLSKDSGSFNSSGGSVSEVANGWYVLAANTTDTGTLGDLAFHCTATGADNTDFVHQVVVDLPGGTVSSVTGSVASVTNAVTISAGTGTGQLDFTSGVVKVNLVQILGTALTETSGQIAAGFKKWFNVASPTSTMNEITLVDTATTVTNGVTVSTNNDKTGYTVSTVSDKTGYSLSTSGIQGIWDRPTSNLTTASSIGLLLTTDLDTNIGSRAPSSTALSTATWTSGRASNLDNLDTTVSSRLATSGYTSPPAAATVAQAVWDEATSSAQTASSMGLLLTTDINATISSRLATSGYTTPPTVTAIRTEMDTNSTKLANLDATISSRAPSATALSTAIWTSGRASNLDNLDATVSSRNSTSHFDSIIGTPVAGSISADIATVNSLITGVVGWQAGFNSVFQNAVYNTDLSGAPADPLFNGSSIGMGWQILQIANIPTNPLLAGSYVAPDNVGIGAIKAKTDNLPADPASQTATNNAIFTH